VGAPKQTIGYRYYFSIHMGIGRRVNEIAAIRVNDIPALDSPVDITTGGRLVRINKPKLFGGDKKEGGIDGLMYVYSGHETQTLQPKLTSGGLTLPSISETLGGDVPNFRGVTTIWYDGLVCSMNPYPKEWAFRVRRHNAGWYQDKPWYSVMARIVMQGTEGEVHAMNGAHILYEVNTNPEWGRGMPPELIDEESYVTAANKLCAEGFGLCIPWFRQENIKEFIPVVINHIGAAQYVDRETGKMTIRLIRGDYDVNDLPLFTPDTGLLDIIDEDNSAEETAYNEIVCTGFDPTTKEEIQVRVQNLASIQAQGEIISNTTEYKGIPTRDLLARVAQRDMRIQLPLRRMTVVLDRRGWRIAPGMPFRISHPGKGIVNLVLRAGECVDGPLTSGSINIKAVEDVFGMPETAYVVPQEPRWTRPDFTPLPSPEKRLYEMNWRDIYRLTSPADRDAIVDGNSYVAVMARPPEGIVSDGYEVLTRPEGTVYDEETEVSVGWTGWLRLETPMLPLDTTLTFEEQGLAAFLTEYKEGMVVLIDDEQMQFVAFDEISRLATVKRAVADTIPASHNAGASIWLVDDELGTDGTDYQDGETVYALALTRTSTAVEAPDENNEMSIVVDQRVVRPYPPGNVKVGGVSVYTSGLVNPQPAISWAHRDRVLQGDTVIGHVEGSVGPEPGVTYNIRVYSADGLTLLRSVNVGAVDTWTYDATMQAADGGPTSVWFELESVRGEIISFFHYRFAVTIVGGWGYGWGTNWGKPSPQPEGFALDPDSVSTYRGSYGTNEDGVYALQGYYDLLGVTVDGGTVTTSSNMVLPETLPWNHVSQAPFVILTSLEPVPTTASLSFTNTTGESPFNGIAFFYYVAPEDMPAFLADIEDRVLNNGETINSDQTIYPLPFDGVTLYEPPIPPPTVEGKLLVVMYYIASGNVTCTLSITQ